jgi:uncharacterized protein YjbI with pentapeptide repeats
MANARLGLAESWDFLRQRGHAVPFDEDDLPLVSGFRPCGREAEFRGLRFAARTYEEVDYERLTMPRTWFEPGGRYHGVSFRDSDLALSCLNDTEWIDCDLSGALLYCADLAGARFFGCHFAGALLAGADLCGASFEHCDFTDANLTGASLYREQTGALELSDRQRRLEVDWQDEDEDL